MSAAVSNPIVLRTCGEDGAVHYSDLKTIRSGSGVQYLHACNATREPTSAMLLGTLVHFLLLGPRPGAKPLVKYTGGIRRGKEWDAFLLQNADAEILTAKEWAEGEAIADAVRRDPIASERLSGAKFEIPLRWTDQGILCATSGVDAICADGSIADLKTTNTTEPRRWLSLAFRMGYAQQLAFYRRGAAAAGIVVKDLYLIGVETRAPFECVTLKLTPDMIDFADREISLWLEQLRNWREAIPHPTTVKDWPGYAQSSVAFDVPAWAKREDEGADDDLEDADDE